jgi:small subunit ribosomal protein S8
MNLTDPVADMLTRIRNACTAGHRRVDMPVSNLKYHNDEPVIRELRRVSAPGLRRYVKCREIPRVKNGLGMAIVSTPKGLMTDREARTANLGGELLAVVW